MRTIKDVDSHFFNLFLNNLFNNGYWEKNCKKSVNQASVNQKDISKVPFNYPELETQILIVKKMEAIANEISNAKESAQKKLNNLNALSNSLLSHAVSGKLI